MSAVPSKIIESIRLDAVRDVIEFLPDAVLVIGEDSKIAFANPQAEMLFEYPAKDMIGHSIEMLVPRRFREQHKLDRRAFVADSQVRPMGNGLTVYARRKDGIEIPCDVSLSNVRTAQGVFTIATTRAVPERKELEVAIQDIEENFRPLLELTNAFPWRADAQTFQVSYVGPQFEELLGYPREKWCEMGFWPERIHPDDREYVLRSVREMPKTKDRFDLEYRIIAADGKEIWIRDFYSVLRANGVPKTLHGFFIDVTRQRNEESKLRKSVTETLKQKMELEQENVYLRQKIKLRFNYDEIVGNSRPLLETLKCVEHVAQTNTTVLIQGETGTGKELIARAIHNNSQRSERAMVTVNCAALPPSLIEAELFGREKGAYTGAMTSQTGRFELAHGSTIFLDEISELSTELQINLLRVLEVGEFERLGSSKTKKVDVRVIAATNSRLDDAVKKGDFREDLYYRLNVFPIDVPPLRDRIEDIPQLVWTFIRAFEAEMRKKIEVVLPETMEALQRHYWPGNVRELKNMIERAIIWSEEPVLQVDVTAHRHITRPMGSLRSLNEVEHDYIESVLDTTQWRVRGVGGASEILGLKPTTLEARMKKLGIRRKA